MVVESSLSLHRFRMFVTFCPGDRLKFRRLVSLPSRVSEVWLYSGARLSGSGFLQLLLWPHPNCSGQSSRDEKAGVRVPTLVGLFLELIKGPTEVGTLTAR